MHGVETGRSIRCTAREEDLNRYCLLVSTTFVIYIASEHVTVVVP
jgi:hypothetical protein